MKQASQATDVSAQTHQPDQSKLLVLPPRMTEETAVGRHIVPPERLEPETTIELIHRSPGVGSSWQSPLTSVVTLISPARGVRVDVVTLQGKRRTAELDRFCSVTVWPGCIYQVSSQHEGDIIRLQRSLKAVQKLTNNEPPPTSGYSLFFPSPISAENGIIDILPPSALPGFEVKLVEGFTEMEPLYHQTFDAAYYNMEGALTVKLTPDTTGRAATFDVPVGGCAVIPRDTVHHVIGGSPTNKIVVFYWPQCKGQPGNESHSVS